MLKGIRHEYRESQSYCCYKWWRLLRRHIDWLFLKIVVKVVAIVVGLFFAGLAYLQYQEIVAIKWNKVPQLSQKVVMTLANATNQIPGFNSGHPADIAISNFGIPLTGSMSVGFAIGFMKG
ncbi:MAG: FUN14 domain-containing protein [Candidatus Nitrosopolaris sp.]